MRVHAYVLLPKDVICTENGELIEYDSVYDLYVLPVLLENGLTPIRTGGSGDFGVCHLADLSIADILIVDVSIESPEIWYQVGLRQALRPQGIVFIRSRQRRGGQYGGVPYEATYSWRNGTLDAESLESDKAIFSGTLKRLLAKEDWGRGSIGIASGLGLLATEVYSGVLPGHALSDIGRKVKVWSKQLEVARCRCVPEDLLLLSEIAPTLELFALSRSSAADILLDLGNYRFAIEQYSLALRYNRDNDEVLRQLCRTYILDGNLAKAKSILLRVKHRANNAIYWKLCGDLEVSQWANMSMRTGGGAKVFTFPRLQLAIDCYKNSFRLDPSLHSSGASLLFLLLIESRLEGRYLSEVDIVAGGLVWACSSVSYAGGESVLRSISILSLLCDDEPEVYEKFRRYASALKHVASGQDSILTKLEWLSHLSYRPCVVRAAISGFKDGVVGSLATNKPHRVILFSGHMIDSPDRLIPRFPAENEGQATAEISKIINHLAIGPNDLALAQGASGGDMIFLEKCHEKGARIQLMLPMDETEFIDQSLLVATDGYRWRERYLALRNSINTKPRVMTDEIGAIDPEVNLFELCNLWLKYSALSQCEENLHFICLWDGAGGDGPGGTAHMFNEIKKRSGKVHWINTTKFF
ncbi:tetratricopeptide repeat protein [Pseudomonas mosselii]|uniref:tetratricopeptide repeat protein n=1 Tax=Pseudomonas mosselii TaxID=78327 RepID=UPI0021D95A2D|nr:tetratricopeptide repeat protein [Pseudomonas mosselii]MCU9528713.1 tetratricopeptide repeat protein [Pseudomonas mosselii]MCU9536048.1 tetratricopeptide repeat protein [Pseudomonas mosselii]MCU9541683.1 tetratricopeptide repeat protein [Pseudomonas mosselii]MCU9547642.1 tetratricopeptide repeat protein [Pseudomonas mosselii]